MSALWQVFRLVVQAERRALLRGAALSFLVLAMGVALLGLSGWFITAAAAAGLLGAGAVFDVFRPGAMVRFLALGRAASRYGERLLTHDATLRALEVLRGRLLAGLLAAPYARMVRVRGAQALSRLTADIDMLDGVSLRLVVPLLSGLAAQLVAFAALWLLIGPVLAVPVLLGSLLGAALIFGLTVRRAAPLSRRGEAAGQALRGRLIDLVRARRELAVQGLLVTQAGSVMDAEGRRMALRRAQDRAERRAGAAIAVLGGGLAALSLGIGMTLVQAGNLSPALAALGFFATLALGETLVPLRRAAGDLGRMAEAARRVVRDLDRPVAVAAPAVSVTTPLPLAFEAVAMARPGSAQTILSDVSFRVDAGEAVALTGPSGAGKSTLLLAAAGLLPIAAGRLTLGARDILAWDEAALRAHVALLPQRSALMAGSVADALALAAPDASDSDMWDVLRLVRLERVLRSREGLETRIGARGDGLSGGEGRRLALARALLRRPGLLLLDEPTEGLDDAMARALLDDLRAWLPQSAILIAAHRRAEVECVDQVHAIG